MPINPDTVTQGDAKPTTPIDTTPTADTGPGGDLKKRLTPVTWTPEEIQEWWARIEEAEQRTKTVAGKWDILLASYVPSITDGSTGEDVKANSHFRNVHTKMGQIFVKSPEVRFVPEGPTKDQIPVADPTAPGGMRPMTAEEAVLIKQNVINKKLGRDEINVGAVMNECLFDIQAWSGIACVKVGYTVIMKPIQKPVMIPDPNFQQPQASPGSILQLAPQQQPPMIPQVDPNTGQPATQMVEVPIWSEWYAKRMSPKKILMNADLSSGQVDKDATWVGMKFYIGRKQAMRQFGLSDHELGPGGAEDKDTAQYDDDQKKPGKDLIEGYELFIKGSQFRDDELHPQAIYQLTMLKGVKDKPVVSRKSPDQTFDPNTGQLTPDSLVGFPIKIGSNRVMADTVFVIADSGFTNSQAKFLDTHRQQSVKLRDAQIGKYLYDAGAFEDDDIERLKNGTIGDFIAVTSGSMANGSDKIFVQTSKIQGSQDDYRMASIIKADMDETLGISATQSGAPTEGIRSATEIQSFSSGSAGRMEKEKDQILDFYLSIVRALDQLITRYASGENYIMIEGEDGARKIAMWNKKLLMTGVYGYQIKTDSQLKIDSAQDRQQRLSFYNLTAADPLVNRVAILRELARDFGMDPTKVIIDPELVAAGGGLPPAGGPANKHEVEKSGGKPNAPGSSPRGDRNPPPPGGAGGAK